LRPNCAPNTAVPSPGDGNQSGIYMSEAGRTKILRPDRYLLRGSVVSERYVHPCGKWPRPTGRDIKVNMDPRANLLLANLPRADFKLIESHLAVAPFMQGAVLAEVGDEIDQVYFPLSGMISLLTTLNDGKAIETA